MPRLNHQKRLEIALAILRGEDVAKICAQFGVHQNTLPQNQTGSPDRPMLGFCRRNSKIARLKREHAHLKQLVADQARAISIKNFNAAMVKGSEWRWCCDTVSAQAEVRRRCEWRAQHSGAVSAEQRRKRGAAADAAERCILMTRHCLGG